MPYKNIDSVYKRRKREKEETVSRAKASRGNIKNHLPKLRFKRSHLQKLTSLYLMMLMVLQSMMGVFMWVPKGNEAKGAGNIYYVSTSGSDTNNGTSPSSSWAHHPWDMNATGFAASTVLQPGDSVYYKKGETFYETYLNVHDSGSADNPITISSVDTFGSGADPILSGAWNPNSLVWSLDNGTIYKTLTVNAAPNIVVYNSTILTKGSSKVLNANQWWWGDDGGTNYLFVNVGENPTTGILQAGKQDYIILNSLADNITLSNIQVQVPNKTGVTVGPVYFYNNHSNFIFDNLIIKYFPMNGIGVDSVSNITVTNTLISTGLGYGIGAKSVSGNLILQANTIFDVNRGINVQLTDNSDISNNTIYNLIGNGIVLNQSNFGKVTANIIHDSTLTDAMGNSGCVSLINSNSTNVYLNSIYNCKNGFYYGANGRGDAVSIYGSSEGNNIYKNLLYNNYVGINYSSDSGNGGDKIYDNLLYDQTVNDISIYKDSGTNPIEVYNNTVIHNPSANNIHPYTGHGLTIQMLGKKAKFANNLVINIAPYGVNNQGIYIYIILPLIS